MLGLDYAGVTDTVCKIWEDEKMPKIWWITLGVALSLLAILGACVGHLIMKGVGVWGNNNPAIGVGRSSTSFSGSVSATRER